jgi:hypothetical protein
MKTLPMKLSIVIFLMIIVSVTSNGHAAGSGKVTICHIPPGNPSNAHSITVSRNAVSAHMAHGDTMGPCASSSGAGVSNLYTVCDDRTGEIGRKVTLTLTGRVQSQRIECD